MPPQVKLKKANNIWFAGICDELYRKIALWDYAYWNGGEVHSTRLWLNPKSLQTEPKPTKMAHYLPIREIELEHLIRILKELKPNSPMLEEWQNIQKIWKYAKPVLGYYFLKAYWSRIPLPKGIHRVVTVVFYPEHVKELLATLSEAKTGQKSIALELAVEKAKQEGKDLFEE